MARPSSTSLGWTLGTRTAGSPITPALTGTVNVLCMGDSVTFGYGVGAGSSFRADLKTRLTAAGVTSEFVGPISDGVSPDPQHWGVPGARISDFVAGNTVNSYSCDMAAVSTYSPHVIVVHLGLNDFAAGSDGLASMASFLTTLYAEAPTSRVVVCKPHRWTTSGYNASHAAFIAGIAATVAASSHGADGLALVADTSGLCVPLSSVNGPHSDLVDYVHPNTTAFEKIAGLIWPTVCNAVGLDAQW